MQFDVIPIADREQWPLRETYQEAVEVAGDVFYRLDYLSAIDGHDNGKVYVACLVTDWGTVAYPFAKRPVPFAHDYCDIVTPYEYGGPFASANESVKTKSLLREFEKRFTSYCHGENVVSEFVRFNPLLENHLDWDKVYELRLSCRNVIVDLSSDLNVILSGYHESNRRNIRRAERSDVVITEPDADEAIKMFLSVYEHTMEAKDAGEYYLFSPSFFEGLFRMHPRASTILVAQTVGGKPVASNLFLHHGKRVHYFLGGSLRAYSELRASNLLMHTAINRFRDLGFDVVHLGGASPSQNGLLRFKGSFSQKRRSYFVGRRIHDREAYDALTSAHYTDHPDRTENDFFPAYRAP